jgi:hypothetical protein
MNASERLLKALKREAPFAKRGLEDGLCVLCGEQHLLFVLRRPGGAGICIDCVARADLAFYDEDGNYHPDIAELLRERKEN